MKKQKALSTVETQQITPQNSQGISIENLLQQAVTNKVPLATVERIMAMRGQLKAEWAKEQFNTSMAAFQSECPPITKTKAVYTNTGKLAYKFAPIDSIVIQVKALIQKHGFSYSSEMSISKEDGQTLIKAILKINHKCGHSEETSMTVPLGGKTSVMSDTQVVAAAQTFAKRYAFINAFGILTSDEDNEAVLKQEEKPVEESNKIPQGVINAINSCKTLEELAKYSKAAADASPHLRPQLIVEYTRRKNEIEDAVAEEISNGIENQKGEKHE